MICPFKNPSEIRDPRLREATKQILACAACPTGNFCDWCECLKCPFFPDQLRRQLLAIEMKMVKTHPRALAEP